MASKNEITFQIMQDNADRSMNEVLHILAEALGRPGDIKFARGYYTFGLRNGMPGEKPARAPKESKEPKTAKEPKTPKEPKAPKAPKVTKVPKPKVEKDRKPVKDLTVEEINDIKAKNLARMKQVAQKFYKNAADGARGGFTPEQEKSAKKYVQDVTNDLDSFKSPDYLTADEVKALI